MEISIEVKRINSNQSVEYRVESCDVNRLVDVTNGMDAETNAKPEQVEEIAEAARIEMAREIAQEWADTHDVVAICEAWDYDEDGEIVNLREMWRIDGRELCNA